MSAPTTTDDTVWAAAVKDAIAALDALPLDSRRQELPIRLGLLWGATRTAVADALVAWAEVAADVQADAESDQHWAWCDALAVLLRELLPGTRDADREMAGEGLAGAGVHVSELMGHYHRGTTPVYEVDGGVLEGEAAQRALDAEWAQAQEDLRVLAVQYAAPWGGPRVHCPRCGRSDCRGGC